MIEILTVRVTLMPTGPVMEPVGVVGDQLEVRVLLIDLDFAERELDRFISITPGADQTVLLDQDVFRGIEQAGHDHGGPLAGEGADLLFAAEGVERELQVSREIAIVGQEGVVADLGERVVVRQPEGHADPIVLILLRQRWREDLGRLLDRDRRSVIGFKVIVAEPHRLDVAVVSLGTASGRPGACPRGSSRPT